MTMYMDIVLQLHFRVFQERVVEAGMGGEWRSRMNCLRVTSALRLIGSLKI